MNEDQKARWREALDALADGRGDGLDPLNSQQLVAECLPYLRAGETPADCIVRCRRDLDLALTLLAREKSRAEQLQLELSRLSVDGK